MRLSVWLAGALLAVVAGLLYRARLRAYRRASTLSDDHIRSIEALGRVEVDEPLDLDEIRREERRFLEEATWDEPDED